MKLLWIIAALTVVTNANAVEVEIEHIEKNEVRIEDKVYKKSYLQCLIERDRIVNKQLTDGFKRAEKNGYKHNFRALLTYRLKDKCVNR